MAGSRLMTDEGTWYEQLGEEFIDHNTVNHSADEYVDRGPGSLRIGPRDILPS